MGPVECSEIFAPTVTVEIYTTDVALEGDF